MEGGELVCLNFRHVGNFEAILKCCNKYRKSMGMEYISYTTIL
jgi:hypothetical protein